jgi:hypothetical protein
VPEEPEEAPVEDERGLGEVIADALADYLGDEGMVTGFIVHAEFMDTDGDEAWMHAVRPGQTQARTLGLVEFAREMYRHDVARYLAAAVDDED